jgi:hypothetical protein
LKSDFTFLVTRYERETFDRSSCTAAKAIGNSILWTLLMRQINHVLRAGNGKLNASDCRPEGTNKPPWMNNCFDYVIPETDTRTPFCILFRQLPIPLFRLMNSNVLNFAAFKTPASQVRRVRSVGCCLGERTMTTRTPRNAARPAKNSRTTPLADGSRSVDLFASVGGRPCQ